MAIVPSRHRGARACEKPVAQLAEERENEDSGNDPGCVDEAPQLGAHSSVLQKAKIATGGFVVAGGDAARVLRHPMPRSTRLRSAQMKSSCGAWTLRLLLVALLQTAESAALILFCSSIRR